MARAVGEVAVVGALLRGVHRCSPHICTRTSLPLITIHLAAGAAARSLGLVDGALLALLAPVHLAALGCITVGAGSELALEHLRRNARVIRATSISVSFIRRHTPPCPHMSHPVSPTCRK